MALKHDVPTPLRQNPAAKDHSRLAREALMHCAQPWWHTNKGQRSARVTNARAAAPSQLTFIAAPADERYAAAAPATSSTQHCRAEVTPK